jgi:hypothetical protein
MSISLTGATVDTGVPAQNVRAPSSPVISTAGNDAQSIARQQTPSAVPAPALLAAYSTGIAPQTKPAPKPLSSLPSSTFAAQFIAQGDAGSDDDLAIFVPPPPLQTAEESPADDYLNDLRVARGDISAANKTEPTEASEQADTLAAVQTAKSAATAATETVEHSGITVTLPHPSSQFRRATIVQAKGVSAYQIAQMRNGSLRRAEPAPEAVN